MAALVLGTYGTAPALVGMQLNILPLMLLARVSDGGTDFPVAAAPALVLTALCSIVLAVVDVLAALRERNSHEN